MLLQLKKENILMYFSSNFYMLLYTFYIIIYSLSTVILIH